MKNKIIAFLLAIAAIACASAFAACNSVDDQTHSHLFTEQVVTAQYLESVSTCTEKAHYYYSWLCGKKGEDTFEYGEPKGHDFSKQIIEEKYLKSEASCTEKAKYYLSCLCGEKGEDTYDY